MLIVFMMMFVSGCVSTKKEVFTNDIYLIPKDYEGSILVFYGIPEEPELKKEGDFDVIPVRKEFLQSMSRSDYPNYGVALTSTPFPYEEGGTMQDKFYYVDSNGDRTFIPETCIHYGATGSVQLDNQEPVYFQDFQVTRSECSQDFYFDGKEIYYDQLKEVQDYWFNELGLGEG